MSGRGHLPAPGMMRHGLPPGIGGPAGHRALDSGVGAHVAEIDHLIMENRRLAASITAMRRDRAMADDEVQRLRAHIRSVETESDIQIRVLLEKISKLELGLKAGEGVKKDLQQAHKEAQGLVVAREELISKIQQASQELEKWHNDIKRIPDMLSDLENMKQEHQHLRTTFECEKRMNLHVVEHMQKMEQTLVSMNREVESLRAEIQNVEKRVQAPYGGAYPNREAEYPTLYQSSDPFYDPYRRAVMEGTIPHSNANGPSPAVGIAPSPPVLGAAGVGPWIGAYDPNNALK